MRLVRMFVVVVAGATSFACSRSRPFGDSPEAGGVDASYDQSFALDDDASDAGCQGLKCQWTACSAQGKNEIALTGTVYDPAGNLPLYDVYVYVPNTQPDPIHLGEPDVHAVRGTCVGRAHRRRR